MIKLKDIEVDILKRFSEAEGSLLDDIELIETLEYSVKLSDEIAVKVRIAKDTFESIKKASE